MAKQVNRLDLTKWFKNALPANDSRPSLTAGRVIDGVAYASDGYVLFMDYSSGLADGSIIHATKYSNYYDPDCHYPDVKAVLPSPNDYGLTLTVNAAMLRNAMKAVQAVIDAVHGVKLTLTSEPVSGQETDVTRLTLTAYRNGGAVVTVTLPVSDVAGELTNQLTFNPGYIENAVKGMLHADNGEIALSVNDGGYGHKMLITCAVYDGTEDGRIDRQALLAGMATTE